MEPLFQRSRGGGMVQVACMTALPPPGKVVTAWSAISSGGYVYTDALCTASGQHVRHVASMPGHGVSFLELEPSGGNTSHDTSSGGTSGRNSSAGGASTSSFSSLTSWMAEYPFEFCSPHHLAAGAKLCLLGALAEPSDPTKAERTSAYGTLKEFDCTREAAYGDYAATPHCEGAPVLVGKYFAGIHMGRQSLQDVYAPDKFDFVVVRDEVVRPGYPPEVPERTPSQLPELLNRMLSTWLGPAEPLQPSELSEFVPTGALVRCMRDAGLIGPSWEEMAVRRYAEQYARNRSMQKW